MIKLYPCIAEADAFKPASSSTAVHAVVAVCGPRVHAQNVGGQSARRQYAGRRLQLTLHHASVASGVTLRQASNLPDAGARGDGTPTGVDVFGVPGACRGVVGCCVDDDVSFEDEKGMGVAFGSVLV